MSEIDLSDPRLASDTHPLTARDDSPNSALCSKCQFVFEDWSEDENGQEFPHYDTILEVDAPAKAGCPLCALFSKAESVDDGKRMLFEDWINKNSLRVSFRTRNDSLGRGAIEIQDGLDEQYGSNSDSSYKGFQSVSFSIDMVPSLNIRHRPAVPRENISNTRDSLSLVQEWFHRCSTTHDNCRGPTEEFKPTRLIDLGSEFPVLRMSNDIKGFPDYAALSHCWGQFKFQRLEKNDLKLFQKRIPSEALGKTFRDAIHVTRQLGLQYLWIDSLCIIQNDLEDWTTQSALMTKVYGNTTINIAASGTVDGNGGLFFNRNESQIFQVQVRSSHTGERSLYDCVRGEFYKHSMASMPLHKRDWTLQERLLPCRNIQFTATEIFWECFQGLYCESFPVQFPQSLGYTTNFFWKEPVKISMWPWIVAAYTSSDLTEERDKLVAISGIAQLLHNESKIRYLAGLWCDSWDLEVRLLDATVRQLDAILDARDDFPEDMRHNVGFSPGEYKRVGLFRHVYVPGRPQSSRSLLPMLSNPEFCAKDEDYADVSYDEDGNARRIIVLV
ncbi:hypothetical protein G7Y89_g10630 [Cudoniella acicularis]|uniref:Heterokaryon incompatibility domain-containing protein n=1 Tax=Cudoniella acicularis TaxID=354080 RepID=A0A8H4W1F2_9HELO|nr:hypothetical protein G7Y89_g10630 [Cudoniella acicularis]